MRRLFFLLSLICIGCGLVVSDDRAITTMNAEGWTNVTVTSSHRISPHWVGGCSSEDDAAFDVAGTNPAGKAGTATVCCGAILKGCTVRH